jgi:hypothetical protein
MRTDDKLYRVGLVLIGGIGAYFLLRSIVRDNAQNNAFVSTNINAQVAARLLAAMNPSGFDWLFGFDGTDEAAIFTASQVATSYAQVASYYRQMTRGRVLGNDLRAELNDTDYQRIQQLFARKP